MYDPGNAFKSVFMELMDRSCEVQLKPSLGPFAHPDQAPAMDVPAKAPTNTRARSTENSFLLMTTTSKKRLTKR